MLCWASQPGDAFHRTGRLGIGAVKDGWSQFALAEWKAAPRMAGSTTTKSLRDCGAFKHGRQHCDNTDPETFQFARQLAVRGRRTSSQRRASNRIGRRSGFKRPPKVHLPQRKFALSRPIGAGKTLHSHLLKWPGDTSTLPKHHAQSRSDHGRARRPIRRHPRSCASTKHAALGCRVGRVRAAKLLLSFIA